MALSNFERMIQLADEVFAVKSDPNQLDVNEEVLDHLRRIHPATVSEYDDGHGPVAWVLVIPTTLTLMKRFIKGEISERELYEQTPQNITYDAIYLCSAMVLEEYRRKGITKQLTMEAIESIRKNNPIESLFVWNFSEEGEITSAAIAQALSLPLLKRVNH
jgi:ribosomal protein S18 acetylase RimI-like enzyme